MKKLFLIPLSFLLLNSVYANEAVEALGERLFNDHRFSKFFHDRAQGDANHELINGAPELEFYVVRDQSIDSPFAGSAMSCASCHMVDQAFETIPKGMRGYNDFAIKTAIPTHIDGKVHTLRNTPALIGIGSKYAQNRFSHYDGEFFDHSQTVLGNFLGRNMGWMRQDKNAAMRNVVNIIKNDNGLGELAQEFGGSYERILLGIDPLIPEEFKLPKEARLDVTTASEKDILNKVTEYVTAYLNGIDFEKDEQDLYSGSPYDEFLKINHLPREPQAGESLAQYNSELIRKFLMLDAPKFVAKRLIPTHEEEYQFGEKEWQGLKVFFNIGEMKSFDRGMCVNCHMAPLFTDQLFHNVGVTQVEYDSVHGQGQFAKLEIPSLEERKKQYFLDSVSSTKVKAVDLGMWNFFGRADKPELTQFFQSLCVRDCEVEKLLPFTIARFKTPSLRNLGHSGPYMHSGTFKTLEATVEHYIDMMKLSHKRELRNGAPQLNRMNIDAKHVDALAAFLRSLNENYE